MNITVAGIHTGIGKTVASAMLCHALQCDYWKPVQAGDLEDTDSMKVKRFSPETIIHPEQFRLRLAASPHWAAQQESLEITLDQFQMPVSLRGVLTETAGGVYSPLSTRLLNLDLMKHLGNPVVLVSSNYLGSINHTLLTIGAIRNAGLDLKGLIFCGTTNEASESMIASYSGLPVLMKVPYFENLSESVFREWTTQQDFSNLKQLLSHARG